MSSATDLASWVLPGPGRALDQHRLGQPVGQVHHPGDALVGQVLTRRRPSRTAVMESKRGGRTAVVMGFLGASRGTRCAPPGPSAYRAGRNRHPMATCR